MTITKKAWQLSTGAQVPVWVPTDPEVTNQAEPEYAIGVDEEVVYFPYTVPKGWDLHISDISWAAKHVEYSGTTRNSYMHVLVTYPNTWQTMLTVTNDNPEMSRHTPFIMRQDWTLRLIFANNGPEVENMSVVLTGYLQKASSTMRSVRSLMLPTGVTPIRFFKDRT